MPRNSKAALYRALKETGAPLTETYASYTSPQLRTELEQAGVDWRAVEAADAPPVPPAPAPQPNYPPFPPSEPSPIEPPPVPPAAQDGPQPPFPPVSSKPDPKEMPSQRLNTQAQDEIIRVDEQGRQWIQEEVRKPAYPKPRGRRVLKYIETGVAEQTVQAGEYVETFEVAGQGAGRPAEVKITLPSYQVGIYKDPRFPFKIYTYNGREGFDLFEVQNYYGGAELVPPQCKRVYIENALCYEIRSVIAAIRDEFRHMQLTGRVK